MTGKNLLLGLSYIDRKFIEESENDMVTGNGRAYEEPKPGKKLFRRPLLAAAIIVLTLLLAGCAVAYVLSVKDLYIGQVTRTQYELDENRQPISQTEVVLDVISAQGVMGSPNFQASQEWLAFEENYELNLTEAEEFSVPAGYEVYHAFSQEMVDKVDEICEKYGLKPMGRWAHMQSYQFDVLYQALGFDSLFRGGAEVESGVGYFMECGNFDVSFSFSLTGGETDWKLPIGATLHYADKAYFDTVAFSVGDAETVKQRNYVQDDGTSVLLVGEGSSTILLYDREDAFFSLYFDTYSLSGEKVELSDRDIEKIAEAIDFTIKPKKPDMAEVDRLLAEAEQAHQEALEAAVAYPKTYAEVLAALERDWSEVLDMPDRNWCYALRDLNGDGTEELLVSPSEDFLLECYTMMEDGVHSFTHSWPETPMYLCENGVLEIYHPDENGSSGHYYFKLNKDVKDPLNLTSSLEEVWYKKETGNWYVYSNGTEKTLTKEEAEVILARYPRVELEMKPIGEYEE